MTIRAALLCAAAQERVEVGAVRCRDDDLAIDDATFRQDATRSGSQLRKAILQRPPVAARDVDVASTAKKDGAEAVPLGLVEPAPAAWQLWSRARRQGVDRWSNRQGPSHGKYARDTFAGVPWKVGVDAARIPLPAGLLLPLAPSSPGSAEEALVKPRSAGQATHLSASSYRPPAAAPAAPHTSQSLANVTATATSTATVARSSNSAGSISPFLLSARGWRRVSKGS
jgi:hypothetical protein